MPDVIPAVQTRRSLQALEGARLPDTPDPLIGRERELEHLLRLLRQPEIRLLTLTGAGGTGKTRLAIELAVRVRDNYDDGLAFVDLAPVAGPHQVSLAIAQGLGVRETAEFPIEERLPVVLRERDSLLLLDNFEHVLDAASLVAGLLATCPQLTILVTSRAPLRLALEHDIRVPPLDVPDPVLPRAMEDIAHVAAVRYFVNQAQKVAPGFALTPSNSQSVVAICRRLDGLPLAIKLAAGRSRVLEPAAMLARLEQRLPLLTSGQRDVPTRQRTMRDTIAWSCDLLREHEQVLFRRLAVFAGGFTLELAEAVSQELAMLHQERGAQAGEPPILILDTLEALIDQHLIEREQRANGDIRFSMLETIREYALEQLDASGEGDIVRTAHAAALVTWAERAKPFMFGPEQGLWLARGEAEQPNILAALGWALELANPEVAYRLASANGPNWFRRSRFREALAWLDRVFTLPAPAPDEAFTFCHILAGVCAKGLDLPETSLAHIQTALGRARESGDALGEGMARMNLGGHLLDIDIDAAERENDAAFALLRSVPDLPRMSFCLQGRARIAQRRGDYDRFAELARDAYDFAVSIGDWLQVIDALLLRAQAARLAEAFQEALGHVEEAIQVARQIDSTPFLAFAICDGAMVAHARGDHRLAARWAIVGRMAEAAAGIFPDREYTEQQTMIMDAAARAIGPDAFGVEVEAAGGLSLSAAVDEIRAYRRAVEKATAMSAAGPARLTAREVEVLQLVASGLTDARIADTLFIARPTASRHVGNILAKLDAATRTEAVDNAYRLGLIEQPAIPNP